jgi:hypothetical protein
MGRRDGDTFRHVKDPRTGERMIRCKACEAEVPFRDWWQHRCPPGTAEKHCWGPGYKPPT